MSLPEVLLWQRLSKRPAGLKFRRQQVAGAYVGDFYCHEAELLIEIDGEAHNRGNAPVWECERDAEIATQGCACFVSRRGKCSRTWRVF